MVKNPLNFGRIVKYVTYPRYSDLSSEQLIRNIADSRVRGVADPR
jgi:hypothetical protein